jgi:carboxylesterase type B
MHILSGDPLFDRAILMSGSAPTMGPTPLKAVERSWTKLCKNSSLLGDEKWETKLEKLRLLKPEELMQNCGPGAFFAPVADGKLFPYSWKLGDPHPSSRCKEVITGTTRVEAIMFDRIVQQLPQSLFHKLVLNAFKSASDADLFCKYFGFTPSEEQPFEAYRDAFRLFLTVVIFHFPSLRLAETFGQKAYLYHFEEPSPYDGPTFGLPVHGQCAVFVYNNDRKFWPESAQRVSLEMMKKWTGFAYGETPWEVYTAEKRFMRLGPEGECSLRSFEDDETRNYGYLNWLREHFDEALGLLFSFST